MSSKTLEINAFLTPSTCFTIACLAFSLVAISTVWRSNGRVQDKVLEKYPQRRTMDDNKVNEIQARQAQLASLIALTARSVQRLQSNHEESIVKLIRELTVLAAFLCRIQQSLYARASSLDAPHLATIFESVTTSHQTALSPFADGSYNSSTVERATKQTQNQKPIVDVLLSAVGTPDVQVNLTTDVEVKASLAKGSQPSAVAADAILENAQVVSERSWNEPPPEYSPPDPPIDITEKPKTVVEIPKANIETPGTEYIARDLEAVYTAVTEDDTHTLADLLAAGADHSLCFGELQRTPLHQAAHLNHCNCLSLLLKYGAEASVEDAAGDTALHLAAWAGNVEALTTLLEFGADVDWISGRDGYSPLWCAVTAHQIDAARLLLRHGARINWRAVSGGGLTPLHQAAVTGQGAMCELLLDRGAQPDSVDDDKSTPLHYAAASGSVASVRALLRGGADVEARQMQGLSAVHWAAHKGHTEVLGLLLDHGACLSGKTETGATPLHLAANRGHIAVARLLLERGASCKVGSASWDGNVGTPAAMAIAKGHPKLARMLES